jgi:hypothetical protein
MFLNVAVNVSCVGTLISDTKAGQPLGALLLTD